MEAWKGTGWGAFSTKRWRAANFENSNNVIFVLFLFMTLVRVFLSRCIGLIVDKSCHHGNRRCKKIGEIIWSLTIYQNERLVLSPELIDGV